jgi:hypothetical protein
MAETVVFATPRQQKQLKADEPARQWEYAELSFK